MRISDRRVESGFVREGARRRPTLPPARRLLPVMGVAATLATALVVVQVNDRDRVDARELQRRLSLNLTEER